MSAAPSRLRYLSTLSFDDDWLAELRRLVPDAEVLQRPAAKCDDIGTDVWESVDVVHTSTVLPDPAIARRLRLVQLDTSGVDHVLDSDLWRSTVPITTIGGISPVPLAEYVLFAILGMAHRLPAMLELRTARTWPTPQRRWQTFLPAPVAGATIGIVGYGRIGREIARLADAHGMNVIGVNRTGSPPSSQRRAGQMQFGAHADVPATVTPASQLRTVASQCDYLVVVCPLTQQTRNLVDAEVIGALKPGAVVVNVSRGGIVDEDALLAGLRSGALGGAVLDVFGTEPLPPDAPWWDEPNVLVSPHSAGLAPRYAEQVLTLVAENLRRLIHAEPLLNVVDREQAY